jgi:BlaI family penicillinase repressor
MRNFLPSLSKAEWVIMKKIWELRKTNVREVYEELMNSHEWAYNTVRTIMERLRVKGYLNAKKVGNTLFYEPAVTKNKTVKQALHDFTERVFDGAIGPIFVTLIKDENLSRTEIEHIKNLIKEKEK